MANKTLVEEGFNYDSLLAMDETGFNQALAAKSAKDLAVIENSKLNPNFKALQKKG